MTDPRGVIAIMGSGETTDSMVRVHRFLLDRLALPVHAVFIDTPAGFQMNADDLYGKSREYFEKRLNQPLGRASLKSKHVPPLEAEKAYETLRGADYIFVGPGSPTYALKNWVETPLPEIISDRIGNGACFVAASAAALTLGLFTLPVYEIYKVGEDLHWVPGLNLLGNFGLPIVVIPHWNNAEGGTHDTRFCYMGEPRLIRLESMLPPDTAVMGIDEHTACVLDFASGQVSVMGVGEVTLRTRKTQKAFKSGQSLPLADLRTLAQRRKKAPSGPVATTVPPPDAFLERVETFKNSFEDHLENRRGAGLVDDLLGLDKFIWKSCGEFEEEETISAAREVLREMIVRLGLKFEESPKDIRSILSAPLEMILEIREKLRAERQWKLADEIRDRLLAMKIAVEDTPGGPRWRFAGDPATDTEMAATQASQE